LGILLHPKNKGVPFPLVFTGPESSAEYFNEIDEFIAITLGPQARNRYTIMMNDPEGVARHMKRGIEEVREFRREKSDAFYFNWFLTIDHEFQKPFMPNHENMRNLCLNKDQEAHTLAANLRRAFSGIVAGNVKDEGIRAIEAHGPFQIHGDKSIMQPLDTLLNSFVKQQRMKLPGTSYTPCYKII
jgi:hypothetical protein